MIPTCLNSDANILMLANDTNLNNTANFFDYYWLCLVLINLTIFGFEDITIVWVML